MAIYDDGGNLYLKKLSNGIEYDLFEDLNKGQNVINSMFEKSFSL